VLMRRMLLQTSSHFDNLSLYCSSLQSSPCTASGIILFTSFSVKTQNTEYRLGGLGTQILHGLVARKTKVLLTLHLHHYLAQNCRSMCALNSLVLQDMKKLMTKQPPNWVLSALDAVLWSSGAWANFCTCFISARFMSSLHALSICKLCGDKRFNSLSLFQRRSDDDIGGRQAL
jgi:hypothetical protein